MRLINLYMLFCLIIFSACDETRVRSTDEYCDIEGKVYRALFDKHAAWLQQIYDMGPAPIGGPALFVQDNAGLVFVQAVDGQWYVEYDRWWETEKMLVVLTGRLVKANDDPIGTIGSFGYLYYAGELPAWLLEEYDIQFLENDIYCYKIK